MTLSLAQEWLGSVNQVVTVPAILESQVNLVSQDLAVQKEKLELMAIKGIPDPWDPKDHRESLAHAVDQAIRVPLD